MCFDQFDIEKSPLNFDDLLVDAPCCCRVASIREWNQLVAIAIHCRDCTLVVISGTLTIHRLNRAIIAVVPLPSTCR